MVSQPDPRTAIIDQAIADLVPDGLPTRSPQTLRHVIERAVAQAYRRGQADAIEELQPTPAVAVLLGRSLRAVQALAQRRGVGWQVGRERLFRAADVEALRERKPAGRPRRERG